VSDQAVRRCRASVILKPRRPGQTEHIANILQYVNDKSEVVNPDSLP
jgi:hypothetical protein